MKTAGRKVMAVATLPLGLHLVYSMTSIQIPMEQIMSTSQAEIEEIQRLMDETVDDGKPDKTWQQVLQENPHHKGGLAQLASAERDAQLRSSEAQQSRSMPANSKTKI